MVWRNKLSVIPWMSGILVSLWLSLCSILGSSLHTIAAIDNDIKILVSRNKSNEELPVPNPLFTLKSLPTNPSSTNPTRWQARPGHLGGPVLLLVCQARDGHVDTDAEGSVLRHVCQKKFKQWEFSTPEENGFKLRDGATQIFCWTKLFTSLWSQLGQFSN